MLCGRQSSWIDERTADVTALAAPQDFHALMAKLLAAQGAHEARDAMISELRRAAGSYLELFVMHPVTGVVLASTNASEEGKAKAGHAYFENGKADAFVQSPYLSPDAHAAVITIAAPIRSSAGELVGVLGALLERTQRHRAEAYRPAPDGRRVSHRVGKASSFFSRLHCIAMGFAGRSVYRRTWLKLLAWAAEGLALETLPEERAAGVLRRSDPLPKRLASSPGKSRALAPLQGSRFPKSVRRVPRAKVQFLTLPLHRFQIGARIMLQS
jgi:hypothetical protein